MDIRCSSKYIKEFKELFDKNVNKYPTTLSQEGTQVPMVRLNLDNNTVIPVIMTQFNNGELHEWTRGYDNVKSFLKNGYVKLQFKCPFKRILTKCNGEKCQLFLIRNLTGDCSLKWSAIMQTDIKYNNQ